MGMSNLGAEMQTIKEIAKKNAGAISVCFRLRDALGYMAAVDFALLRQQHIMGSDLWLLYTDGCEKDINRLHAIIGSGGGPELLKAIPGSGFWQLEQAARESRMVVTDE